MAQAESDIRRDCHVRKQRVALEHRVHRAPVRRQRADVGPVQRDAPRIRLHEPGDGAQQRGLAGPGTAEQHEQLTAINGKAQGIERGDRAEADGQSGNVQQRTWMGHVVTARP